MSKRGCRPAKKSGSRGRLTYQSGFNRAGRGEGVLDGQDNLAILLNNKGQKYSQGKRGQMRSNEKKEKKIDFS